MHCIQKWILTAYHIIICKISQIVAFLSHLVYKNATNCAKLAKNAYKDCQNLICTKCTKICYNIKKNSVIDFYDALKRGMIMDRAKYDYGTVCEYIIAQCQLDGCNVTNLQLQKILYYIQGYFLRDQGFPAFDAYIEAWQYGPVVPEAYYDYCIYGKNALNVDNTDLAINGISSREDRKIINKVINKTINLPIGVLIDKTHNEPPWRDVKNLRERISNSKLYDYFSENNPLDF